MKGYKVDIVCIAMGILICNLPFWQWETLAAHITGVIIIASATYLFMN